MAIKEVKAILTAEDRNYTSTMQKAQGVTEGFGKKLKSGIGFGAFMQIGQKAMSVVGNAITQNVGAAVKRLDTLNNFPKVMQSLGFSFEEADAGVKKLANSIDHLPTTLDAVTSQAQQFVPLTGSIEKATDVTLALNNAIAAGGAPAEQQASAINQWTQAMAKGKPDLMDWRSLVQAAPAQMDQLAKSMLGASAGQQDLYQALQKGSVSMDDVNDKMIELTNASEGFDIAGKHYDNFATQAKNASGGINMALVNTKAAVQRNLANIIDAFDQKVSIGGLITSIIEPMNKMGATIQEAFKKADVGTGIQFLLDKIGAAARKFIPKGFEIVAKLLQGIAKALPQVIVGALNMVTGFIKGIDTGQGLVLSKGVGIIKTLIQGLWKALPQILTAAANLIKALALAIWNNKARIVQTAWNLAKQIPPALKKALPLILSAGRSMINSLWSGLKGAFASIPSRVRALGRRVWTAIKGGLGNLRSVGSNLISGLWGGISAKFNSVISRVKAMAARLPAAVKKVLGIASPSKVMKKLGAYTGEGFAIGIEKSFKQVQSAWGGLYNLQPAGALGGNMSATLSDAYDYNVSARYEVVVPVTLNGREIARASANDMQTAINQLQTRESRKVGIR